MAKIFRTEVLAVGGDNIRLTATEGGKFAFKAVNNDGTTGDDVFSLDQVSSDVASLNTKVSQETDARGSDVHTLSQAIGDETTNRGTAITNETNARGSDIDTLSSAISDETTNRGTAISSSQSTLEGLVSTEANARSQAISASQSSLEGTIGSEATNRASAISSAQSTLGSAIAQEATDRGSAISSASNTLNTAISTETSNREAALTSELNDRGSDISALSNTLSSDIESLANIINTENVFATSITLTQDDDNKTFTFPANTFTEAPAVVATIRGTDANDPMVGVMLSGAASKDNVSFGFTDPIPTTTMKLDILASV